MTDAMGPLIETQSLHDRLFDDGLRLLDASYVLPNSERDMAAEFVTQHIPGARFFDIDAVKDETSDLPQMLPSAERFAAAVGAMGIGSEHFVVVYDRFNLAMAASRLWWTFRVFGHDRVAVLDGGLTKWLREGRPIATGAPDPAAPARFEAGFRPELVADQAAVEAALERDTAPVVDARDPQRFAGKVPELRPGLRSGHMPGAVNLPFPSLIAEDGTLLPPDALRSRLEDAGIDLSKGAISSCGSGVTACVLALSAARLGMPDVTVYDGSWTDWARPDGPPVVAAD